MTTHRERLEALEQPTRLKVRLHKTVRDGWIPGYDYPQHGHAASTDDLMETTKTRDFMAAGRLYGELHGRR